MTAGAISHRETRYLFVFVLHLGWIVLMASGAGIIGERGRVTGRTVPTSPAVVHGERMRPVERGRTPGAGGVTGPAAAAKGVSVRRRLGVTGRAGARRAGKAAAAVAVRAGYRSVGPGQREGREVMVEGPVSPGRRSVAGGAVGAERSVVPVVLGMTADARRRRADVAPAGMTRAAGGLGVGAGQGEAGPGMGEGEVLPTARQVAVDAIARELSAVLIVPRVAASAGAADLGPLSVDMARLADHLRVQPRKRKACPVVVEAGATPALRRVALPTRGPQAAVMNLVGAVAIEALGRRGPQGGQGARLPMAEDAFRFVMASH